MYYEIKTDSHAYRKICDAIESYASWVDDKIQEKIRQLLAVTTIIGLYFCPGRLIMENPPAHLKNQFLKPNDRGQYAARENSHINKLWVEFCKQNDLKFVRPEDILDFDFDLIEYAGKKRFYPIGSRFFIISEAEISKDFLKPVQNDDFKAILVDHLAKLKKTA